MSDVEHNKALIHRLIEVVNAATLSALSAVVVGEVAEAAVGWIGPFRASFPDFEMEVADLIAEGDKVVGHFKCSGTHQGKWRGIAATGRRFENVDEIYIFRVEGGRLASVTAVVEDDLSRLRQLGLVAAA
jgi:ketosteroid isomerase-like protein